MKNDTMFSDLDYYKKQEFYDEHPVILLMTPDRNYKIEVFAGYVTDVSEDAWELNFTDTQYAEWLTAAKEKSCFVSHVSPQVEDRVVTLSTCSYEFDGARSVSYTHLDVYKRQVLHYMLTKRLGAEIDYIVKGIDPKAGVAVGSRLEAMTQKRRQYYFGTDRDGNNLLHSGVCAEARVVSVIRAGIFVDLFGMEVYIPLRELSYQRMMDAAGYFQPGQRILVKILEAVSYTHLDVYKRQGSLCTGYFETDQNRDAFRHKIRTR